MTEAVYNVPPNMLQEVPMLPPASGEPPAHDMDISTLLPQSAGPSRTPTTSLKRRASSSLEDPEGRSSYKKAKEGMTDVNSNTLITGEPPINGQILADELEQELQCGCCSALVYRPVLVSPCQHFFCGSCIVLWIKNGGTNCPACRGMSTAVTPSRALQTMTDILVRAAPSKARSVNERMQADDIYKAGISLRIPLPRAPSPEPSIPPSSANYVQPCPHCSPDNQWGWRCPQPIADPDIDPDNAWHNDEGNPPGHAYCGNCENILSLHAPTTTKCDFCQVSFCGISVPQRCVALPLASQHLHMLSDIGDMIQCGDIYEVFDGNAVEVDILLDYMTANNISPRHIYREVVGMILSTPQRFQPLLDAEVFVDVHRVAGGIDPDPTAPRNRICRICATEILLWGLRAWWMLERKKGHLDNSVTSRPDCPEGRSCTRQGDHAHAKDYNHVILPRELEPLMENNVIQPQPHAQPQPQPQYLQPQSVAEIYRNALSAAYEHSNRAADSSMDSDDIEVVETEHVQGFPLGSDHMNAEPSTSQSQDQGRYLSGGSTDRGDPLSSMKDVGSSLSVPDKLEYPPPAYQDRAPVPSSQEIVESML